MRFHLTLFYFSCQVFPFIFFIANIKYDKNNHYPTTTYKSILLLFQNTKPYYIPFYTTLYFAFISGRTRNNSLFYLCKLLVKKILTINTDCKLLCFISYLLILDITDTFVIKIFFNSFFISVNSSFETSNFPIYSFSQFSTTIFHCQYLL